MLDSSKPPKQKKAKLGEGHLMAMARQGLRELQNTMYTASNIARDAEPGTFGNPTQGEIARERDPAKQKSAAHSSDVKAPSRSQRERAGRDSAEPTRE